MSRQNRCCPPATFLGLGQPGPPFGGGRASGRPVLGQVSPVPGTASLSVAFPVPPNWAPGRGDEAMGPSEGNSQASQEGLGLGDRKWQRGSHKHLCASCSHQA